MNQGAQNSLSVQPGTIMKGYSNMVDILSFSSTFTFFPSPFSFYFNCFILSSPIVLNEAPEYLLCVGKKQVSFFELVPETVHMDTSNFPLDDASDSSPSLTAPSPALILCGYWARHQSCPRLPFQPHLLHEPLHQLTRSLSQVPSQAALCLESFPLGHYLPRFHPSKPSSVPPNSTPGLPWLSQLLRLFFLLNLNRAHTDFVNISNWLYFFFFYILSSFCDYTINTKGQALLSGLHKNLSYILILYITYKIYQIYIYMYTRSLYLCFRAP